ncbi:hypothetical protein PVOR_24424 [Paenibacillus vortex V453]|uniref:Uncharacterized protein n=1 Tax=Paenibacillus vortex V453 TaxID=715225 RepID=A0A2R9SQ66_9BACL|nr:hypothetical protein PVOR_24424 [Paenibacillus vortex V453]
MLDHFLYDYLYQGVKDMYMKVGKKVKANADLIINANKNMEDIIFEVSELMGKKIGL